MLAKKNQYGQPVFDAFSNRKPLVIFIWLFSQRIANWLGCDVSQIQRPSTVNKTYQWSKANWTATVMTSSSRSCKILIVELSFEEELRWPEVTKKKKKTLHSLWPLRGSYPLFRRFELARVKPNEASIPPMLAGWPAELTASAFNQLVQYASSPSYRAYCHAELAVSCLVTVRRPLPVLIPPTHRGMARLSWPGWLVGQRCMFLQYADG